MSRSEKLTKLINMAIDRTNQQLHSDVSSYQCPLEFWAKEITSTGYICDRNAQNSLDVTWRTIEDVFVIADQVLKEI